MAANRIPHNEYDPKWEGPPSRHPDQVWNEVHAAEIRINKWDQFDILCDEPMCIYLDHIRIRVPMRLEYPASVCTYCGVRSGTRDHLVSKTWAGMADRKWVLTVPACAECNSSISDAAVHSIDGRRAIAKKHLRKKYRRQLNYLTFDEVALEEFGPGLRPMMLAAAEERRLIEYRLAWPTDKTYDIRHLGKSGIDDPFANGLLEVNPFEAAA